MKSSFRTIEYCGVEKGSVNPLSYGRKVITPNFGFNDQMIIGTGIDIVEVERLRKILAGTLKDRFLQRVFTPEEQRFCLTHRDPAPHFSARFAAKEAFFKALGTGCAHGTTWLDVQVRRQEGCAPTIQLYGTALQLSIARGVKHIHLSLTHAGNWAAATITLE